MTVKLIKNTFLNSCTYLIKQENKVFLVDCGDTHQIFISDDLKNQALIGIFLTHCHQDHTYGLVHVLESYPQIKIYCSELTAKGLMDDDMNLSYILSKQQIEFEISDNVVILNEGLQEIEGLMMEVLATPGHSDDCLSYIIGDSIFTGDSYLPFSKVFSKWPRSNKQHATENEHRLRQIINERGLNVYPGHWKK